MIFLNILKKKIKFYKKLKISINSWIYKKYFQIIYPNIKWGKNIRIYGRIFIKIDRSAKVVFGNNITFYSHTKYNYVGLNKPVSIFVGKDAELRIGNNSGFSGTSIYVMDKILIGDYCNFGGNTFIWDTNFHPINYITRRFSAIGVENKAIEIGNDVFIGANTIILKGVTVGCRAIVGAGSIVTKTIPNDEIWAGNPAKFIRSL